MSKKLALFPMTKDMCAVARHPSMLQGYSLSYLFVPGFMHLNNMDISSIDGGNTSSATLSDYNQKALADCHTLFVDYDENIKELSLYSEVIQKAKELGIEVICSHKLENKLREEVATWPSEPPLMEEPAFDRLYEINVPVVTVLSHGDRADQFATELTLRKYFIEAGYKVSQVGSHESSKLFGFSPIPSFMREPRDAYEKTLRFNSYVKELVDSEKPDLLILGVPDGVMKYNNKLLKGLGFLPYIVCSAVKSDLIVLSIYHGSYDEDFFENLSQYGLYHLGTPVNLFNIANSGIEPEFIGESARMKFIDLNSGFILKDIEGVETSEYSLFNILDAESAQKACTAVIEALSDNVSYVK